MIRVEPTEEQGADMAVYQVLVRNLDGKTRCLRFSSSEVVCEDLKAELAVSEGIPGAWQRLVSGTRDLVAGSSLVADACGVFPSCTLLLRLRGGKGGFGSLLRGAATKAGQKKTSNFDACRDMSGRRLRHVNAEKKLKEWKAEAKERELERTAEDFLRKRRKLEEEKSGVAVDLEKFRNASLKAREEVASAVTDGLVEARRLALDLKRKKIEAVEVDAKKPRLRLSGDSDLEDSEAEEDSDDENETGTSGSEKDEAGPSHSEKIDPSQASTSGSSEAEEDEAGPSSSDKSESSGASTSGSSGVEEIPSCATIEASPPCPEKDEASQSEVEEPSCATKEAGPPCPGKDEASQSGVEEILSCTTKEASPPCPEKDEASQFEDSREAIIKEEVNSTGDLSKAVESPTSESKIPAGPLNMVDYKSAKDLEVLGLDRLKEELQKVGLKCGGNLQQRAARLWLLKTIPLEKLDKKLFSKPPRK